VGISLFFTVGMLYLSVFYVLSSYKMELITVDLEIPQWIPHLALPFGFGLISIRLAQVGWLIWQDRIVNLSQGGEPAAEHIEEIID
jgi:TRAP-type C4-dicarboxylate transport system permease small subunit